MGRFFDKDLTQIYKLGPALAEVLRNQILQKFIKKFMQQ